MKIIGIILLVLQVLSLFGAVANGSIRFLVTSGIPYAIGFFSPTIVAIILLRLSAKRAAKKKAAQKASEE